MKLEAGVRNIFSFCYTALVKIGGLVISENNLCYHLDLKCPQKGPYIDFFKKSNVRKVDGGVYYLSFPISWILFLLPHAMRWTVDPQNAQGHKITILTIAPKAEPTNHELKPLNL